MARCANGEDESPPGGSAGAERHAPAAAAPPCGGDSQRQRQEERLMVGAVFLEASAECNGLLCGGHLLPRNVIRGAVGADLGLGVLLTGRWG